MIDCRGGLCSCRVDLTWEIFRNVTSAPAPAQMSRPKVPKVLWEAPLCWPSCFILENILWCRMVRCCGRANQSHSPLVHLGAGVPRDGESEPWQEQLLRPQDTLLHSQA